MKFTVSVAFLACSAAGFCSIATFDTYTEGFFATTLTDGGITFYDADAYDPDGGPGMFDIEDASSLSDPSFSSPNTLNFGGYSAGPGYGGGRIGSFFMTNGHVETSASMDLYATANGNTATLEAYLEGNLVGSASVVLTGAFSRLNHYTLGITGVSFDTLKFVGSGADQNGAVFTMVDNVRIGAVPEPASFAALAVGAGVLLRRRRVARR
ncbi:MAG: hypothetical protein QOJ65_328 [Fimbriimonadaceae bacterium]|jgi:hypothetical protein|nr:hypothetical protein [Fimbriimonadaceae bacterium]